jgi:hypothetical protein
LTEIHLYATPVLVKQLKEVPTPRQVDRAGAATAGRLRDQAAAGSAASGAAGRVGVGRAGRSAVPGLPNPAAAVGADAAAGSNTGSEGGQPLVAEAVAPLSGGDRPSHHKHHHSKLKLLIRATRLQLGGVMPAAEP